MAVTHEDPYKAQLLSCSEHETLCMHHLILINAMSLIAINVLRFPATFTSTWWGTHGAPTLTNKTYIASGIWQLVVYYAGTPV